MEPRRGRWRVWMLPCIFGEEWRIKKIWCVFQFLGEKYGEKREKKKMLKNAWNSSQNLNFPFLFQTGLPRAIYSPWHALWGPVHLVKLPSRVRGPSRAATNVIVTSKNLSCRAFSVLTLDAHLEVFPDSDWSDLDVTRKLSMSSFQKAKEIKIPMVGLKVMTWGSMLMRISRFSQYPNCFNFDFDPWIVVGMRI